MLVTQRLSYLVVLVLFPADLLAQVPPARSELKESGPAIVVETVYPGAGARQVADRVAAPLGEQLRGLERMVSMTSRCTVDGRYELTIVFAPGVDLQTAQVMVHNRVNLALPILPADVKKAGVTVKKRRPACSCSWQ